MAGSFQLSSKDVKVKLAGDTEIQARASRVEQLLRHVCDDEEFPWFVSDEATIYDVSTLSDGEIASRLESAYRVPIDPASLRLPIWKLLDKLETLVRYLPS